MKFHVDSVLSSSVIRVSPQWKVDGSEGNEVILEGFEQASSDIDNVDFGYLKRRLDALLKDGNVNLYLKEVRDGRAVCEVYLNDVQLSKFIPEFKFQRA